MVIHSCVGLVLLSIFAVYDFFYSVLQYSQNSKNATNCPKVLFNDSTWSSILEEIDHSGIIYILIFYFQVDLKCYDNSNVSSTQTHQYYLPLLRINVYQHTTEILNYFMKTKTKIISSLTIPSANIMCMSTSRLQS